MEKIIQETAFDNKKKKPRLALTGVRTTGPWRLGLWAPPVAHNNLKLALIQSLKLRTLMLELKAMAGSHTHNLYYQLDLFHPSFPSGMVE